MLATSTLGPVIASRVAVGLSAANTGLEAETPQLNWETGAAEHPFTVVVPVYNPQTEQYCKTFFTLYTLIDAL